LFIELKSSVIKSFNDPLTELPNDKNWIFPFEISLLFLFGFFFISKEIFQLVHELLNVLELPID